MPNNAEIFFQEHKSDVFLEEVNHVYVHSETKYIYPSVTGLLESIKTPLEKDRIILALMKNFEDFKTWYFSQSSNEEAFIPLLEKFLKFKEYRDFTWAKWEDRNYKKFKKITQYKSIEELEYELDNLSEGKENLIILKKVYLTNSGQVMTADQIEDVWECIKELANWYGKLIHQILEDFLLFHQKIKPAFLEHKSLFLFNMLNKQIDFFSKRYNRCSHIFKFYTIKDYYNFQEYIIDTFLQIGHDFKNTIYIPEKILYHPKYYLCGMTDMLILYNDMMKFDIGDHKTNINFTTENEYDKWLKPPFNHIEQTDINLYNFQIAIYAIMYEHMTGRLPNDFWISYYNTRKGSFEKLELELYRDEATLLLENHKKSFEKYLTLYQNSGIFAQINKKYHYYLTYRIRKDIEQKLDKGILSNNREENRLYYSSFIKDIVNKIEKHV